MDDAKIREDLEKAVQLQPELTRPRELLVQFYLNRNQPKNAALHLNYLVQNHPDQEKYRLKLGWYYVQTVDWNALDGLIKEGRQHNPGLPEWDLLQGNLLLARGQPAAAAVLFEACYRRQSSPALLRLWVEALLNAGQPEKALPLFTGPGDPVLHPDLLPLRTRTAAMLQRKEKNAHELLADVQAAAVRGAEPADAVLTRIRTIQSPEEFAALLQAAAANDPTGVVRLTQAILLLEKKAYRDALPLLEAIRPLLKDKTILAGKYRLYTGYAAHLAGRFDDASREYELALKALPQDPVILNNLAALLAEQMKQPEKALPLAEKAVSLANGRPEIEAVCLDTLGWARLRANYVFQARSDLEHSLRLKDSISVRLHLAEVYLALKLPEKAAQELAVVQAKAEEHQDQEALAEVKRLQQQITPGAQDKE